MLWMCIGMQYDEILDSAKRIWESMIRIHEGT